MDRRCSDTADFEIPAQTTRTLTMPFPKIGRNRCYVFTSDRKKRAKLNSGSDDDGVVYLYEGELNSTTFNDYGGGTYVDSEDEESTAELRREGRACEAKEFRHEYKYGPSTEERHFVLPDRSFSCKSKSSGIVWAAVHGIGSICVVTRAGDLDLTRVLGYLRHHTVESVLQKFRKTVISELEDFASPDSQLSEYFGPSILKLFGVVSVILDSDQVHKESDHEASSDDEEDKVMPEKRGWKKIISPFNIFSLEDLKSLMSSRSERLTKQSWPTVAGYDEKKTIKFLQEQKGWEMNFKASSVKYDVTAATKFLREEMKGSTVDETIKTAISAFQKLFQNKKFKAEAIEVSVVDPDYFCSHTNTNYTDFYVKHLVMSDIEDYLAAINEPSSRSSSSVGKNMDCRRKDRREARVMKEIDKYQASNPKIAEQFADLKRNLSTLSAQDWESIPDVGDCSRNKKKEKEHMRSILIA